MIGKRVICSHGPGICSNVVNLDVKIGADSSAGNAIDLAVEIRTGMEVGGDGIRGQARVIGVGGRVVAPKGGSGVEVLVYPTKQIDIGTVARSAEPAAWRRKGGDGCPSICRGAVLVSACDSSVVNDSAETIDVATLRGDSISGDGDRIRSLFGPGTDRSARGRSGSWTWRAGLCAVSPAGVQIGRAASKPPQTIIWLQVQTAL